jgi:hypothetical protein
VYPNDDKTWIIRTDGSTRGVDGVLVQLTTVDGVTSEEIICVASKKLSERESKWTVYEIELFDDATVTMMKRDAS